MSRRKLRFIVVPSREDANIAKLRVLVNAAWVTAVAPRGSHSTFLRAEKTKATLVVGDRVDPSPDVTDVVVLFTAVPRQESATPQSILRAAGVEYSTKDVVPRLVTYFDERVVGTPVAMDAVAPFLRPDRLLMRDADDAVRPVILAYSPPLIVLRTPTQTQTQTQTQRVPTAYTAVVDSLVARMFETSEDPGRLLAECTLAVKLADEAKDAASVYDRTRETIVRMNAETHARAPARAPAPAPVIAHLASDGVSAKARGAGVGGVSAKARGAGVEEGYVDVEPSRSRSRSRSRRAYLAPTYPVAISHLAYPRELRDSTRSVRQLTLVEGVLEGVTLEFGDRLALLHQTDTRENGDYMVVGFAPVPILQSPIVINVAVAERHVEPDSDPKRKWHWRFVSARTSVVDAVHGPLAHLRPGDQVVWRAPRPQGIPDGIRARVSRVTMLPNSTNAFVVEAVVSLEDIDGSPSA
ncbi:hypothetical protein FOA52_005431 [Chlamydomonas sp. UWO 241]|nr:hypothetical protein FOA52_005431 [Chlamydomonas sp. UWO 241]